MRSMWAVAAAVTVLLSLPLAVASQALGENTAQVVVHVVLGIGMLLFVRAIFDFGLPRWINAIGALSAALFAVVFLLQAASSLVPQNAALYDLAFGLLGNWPELVLVLGIDSWFVALLLLGTAGRTRYVGWGHRSDRDGLPRHQPGWGHLRDQCPESRGDHPPAPVRVAPDRRCQTWRAGSLGSSNSRSLSADRRPSVQRPGPKA
jgi:hypothetical protein